MRASYKLAVALLLVFASLAFGFPQSGQAPQEQEPEGEHQHTASLSPPLKNFLNESARSSLRALMVQDFQGRMKPLDTLSREMVMKITKRTRFNEWEALDLYLSWLSRPSWWLEQPLLYARHPELKEMLGLGEDEKYMVPARLWNRQGQYLLADRVEEALRAPAKERSKVQKKLLAFDERFNLLLMTLRMQTFRIYPVPGDENNTWLDFESVQPKLDEAASPIYGTAHDELIRGLEEQSSSQLAAAAESLSDVQSAYGEDVLPGPAALKAELFLNNLNPFPRLILPYLFGFLLLISAWVWTLARRGGAALSLGNPLYALGLLVCLAALLFQVYGYTLRWIASDRAPLSNGYESLIFISLMIAVGGLIFEWKERKGTISSLAALLTAVTLGVAMLPTFDPAISPLVPVLNSFWLIIHVTIITASYGFLGLAAIISLAMLIMHLGKRPGRAILQQSIRELNRMNWIIMVTGLAFLSVGTLLGGVWANESWGRYWGWDPKETWALVTILVYAAVAHFRFIPGLNKPWTLAAGTFLAISSVIMTYFGVNYFLSGLHSYAGGDAPSVPGWVFIATGAGILLVIVSGWIDSSHEWTGEA